MDVLSMNTLTSEQLEEIFQSLCAAYSDFAMFPLIAHKLKRAILDTNGVSIGRHTSKKVAEKYFNRKDFNSEESRATFKRIQMIFKSAYVLVLHSRELAKQQANPTANPAEEILWVSKDTFLAEYPEFEGIAEPELELLFNFRNMTKVATLFIDPRLAKQQILNIAGRLEGSQCSYITGGGQREEVTHRVIIYEREGGVCAEPRPDRARDRIKAHKKKSHAAVARAGKRVVSNTSTNIIIGTGRAVSADSKAPRKRTVSALSLEDIDNLEPLNSVSLVSSEVLRAANSHRAPPFPVPLSSAHHIIPTVSSEDTGVDVAALEITPDWSCASRIVQRWELPCEEHFLKALLQGDVLEDIADGSVKDSTDLLDK